MNATHTAETTTTGVGTPPDARRRLTIDPVTRLEGHGKIEIFLDESGNVERAYLQIPELRGFEAFCVGRPAEDMPQITSRICGVCPTAHHMAAVKALDDLYHVAPPRAARLVRELIYHAFIVEDHALHVYLLGGPDFIVGPQAAPAQRNVIGVLGKVGLELGSRVIAIRKRLREVIAYFGGKAIHPVFGLPGGVSKPLQPSDLPTFKALAADTVEFAQLTQRVFRNVVLDNPEYIELMRSDAYTHRTSYLGLVDEQNRVSFYDGTLRVVDEMGNETARFPVAQYQEYVAEHVEPWTYMKFCHLKADGWHGFEERPGNGIYAVAPLARLNAANGMATPLAQAAYGEYFGVLGGRPVHHTLANHWARVVELVYAAERIAEIVNDPELTDPNVRTLPNETPTRGIGVVEAPRGTLIHDYETDARGLITHANLIVATQNNAARIAMSVDRAAKSLIKQGKVTEGLLNMVEMAFRAYDPCFGCATHSFPGHLPLVAELRGPNGDVLERIRQD